MIISQGGIAEYAKEGETLNVMDALKALTTEFIKWCDSRIDFDPYDNKAMGVRTLIYDCGMCWIERLAKFDLPLSKTARRKNVRFYTFVRRLNNDWKDSEDSFLGIKFMEFKDYKLYCNSLLDSPKVGLVAKQAICWGLVDLAEVVWDDNGNYNLYELDPFGERGVGFKKRIVTFKFLKPQTRLDSLTKSQALSLFEPDE